MKKVLIILFISGSLFFGVSYFIFPDRQQPRGSLTAAVSYAAALRQLPDTASWKLWWPWHAQGTEGNQPEGTITLKGISDTQFGLNWQENGFVTTVFVTVSSEGNDSTVLVWSANWTAGMNPLNRVNEFARGKRLENDMKTFLHAFSVYASNPENIYGFKPAMEKVTDTLLITTKANYTKAPGTAEIYRMIGTLEQYTRNKGVKVTGMPMYHITGTEGNIEMMVALPIEKAIEGNEVCRIKRMVDGNLLVAEVKAGPEKLKFLFQQFELCRNDYHLASPAIPYLQPVTNRLQNPDTAQWITKMCYPVF